MYRALVIFKIVLSQIAERFNYNYHLKVKRQSRNRYKSLKIFLFSCHSTYTFAGSGELAQLVERLHGMQEVSGSTPLFST